MSYYPQQQYSRTHSFSPPIAYLQPPIQASPYDEACRSHKSSKLYETHCSLNSSTQIGLDEGKRKGMHSFKKIKESYVQQKNNQGKVVRKVSQDLRKTRKISLVERLEDAMTIYSKDSPRSIKSQDLRIDQSIIILSGRDVDPELYIKADNNQPLQKQEKLKKQKVGISTSQPKLNKTQPKKFFQNCQQNKRSTVKKVKLFPQNLISNKNLNNHAITENGFLINYDIVYKQKINNYHILQKTAQNSNAPTFPESLEKNTKSLKQKQIPNILSIYSILELPASCPSSPLTPCFRPSSCSSSSSPTLTPYLLLAQPTLSTLSNYFTSVQSISYHKFLSFILEFIDILEAFSKEKILPVLGEDGIFVGFGGQLRIRADIEENINENPNGNRNERARISLEKGTIRQFMTSSLSRDGHLEGKILKKLANLLSYYVKILGNHTSIGEKSWMKDKKNQNKIVGMDLFKRMQLKQFIEGLRKQGTTLRDSRKKINQMIDNQLKIKEKEMRRK